MKLAIPVGNGEFNTFTNEDIKVGDKVYPLVNGLSHDGEWYLLEVYFSNHEEKRIDDAVSGWPDEPHTVMSIVKLEGEPLRIYTDKGYSPAQVYFKHITKIII